MRSSSTELLAEVPQPSGRGLIRNCLTYQSSHLTGKDCEYQHQREELRGAEEQECGGYGAREENPFFPKWQIMPRNYFIVCVLKGA